METVRELTLLAIALRTLLATVLGGVIGMERGMKNRPAGLRTYMLVSLGSCLVMMTNQYAYQVYNVGDPTRLAAQVVSGIGFLGAGTIIVTARNQIKGLTTAAGLWAAAGMGLAVGIGFYEGALIGALLIFFILTALRELDERMRKRTRQLEAYVELKPRVSLGAFFRFVRENHIKATNFQMESDPAQNDGAITFVVTLKAAQQQTHEEILRLLVTMNGLAYIEEL